jgi:hypothetical protein
MQHTILNRTLERTHDREVVGGLTVAGELFQAFLFKEERLMLPTSESEFFIHIWKGQG